MRAPVRQRPRSRQRNPKFMRNLSRRLAKPALNNGRLQRMSRRALRMLGAASTSQIMEWTCSLKLLRGHRLTNHDNRAARRALDRIAVRIGRAKTIGRPILWRLREAIPADCISAGGLRNPHKWPTS